ncbi:MAG: hypothetical protein HY593_02900 [Candidatus Omnitrophica bacterium]|nr:hypothetical protein [Candidatus Omnitrophota bacterium]
MVAGMLFCNGSLGWAGSSCCPVKAVGKTGCDLKGRSQAFSQEQASAPAQEAPANNEAAGF